MCIRDRCETIETAKRAAKRRERRYEKEDVGVSDTCDGVMQYHVCTGWKCISEKPVSYTHLVFEKK